VITAVDPSVTVVKKEHPMAVIINDKSDRVMAASLYNRIAFLKSLVVDESNKGHVASDQVPTVIDSLDKTEKELNTKVKSGKDLTFAEAITIGERLDQTANSLKRAKRFRLHTEELAPMVVVSPQEPTVKRLTIFSVTTDKDGDTTTRSSSIETRAY
jgi:predicted type IV restriction endonuclease